MIDFLTPIFSYCKKCNKIKPDIKSNKTSKETELKKETIKVKNFQRKVEDIHKNKEDSQVNNRVKVIVKKLRIKTSKGN